MSKIKKSIWTFKQIFLLDKSIFLNRIIYAILNSVYGFLIAKVLERLINSIENNGNFEFHLKVFYQYSYNLFKQYIFNICLYFNFIII